MGEDEFDLLDVPRAKWEDRVKIEVRPIGRRRIVMRPYPFDEDPLTVPVVARVFELGAEPAQEFQTRWNGNPIEILEFRYGSCEERLDG